MGAMGVMPIPVDTGREGFKVEPDIPMPIPIPIPIPIPELLLVLFEDMPSPMPLLNPLLLFDDCDWKPPMPPAARG